MQVEYRYVIQELKDSTLIHIIAEHENEHSCAVKIYEAKDREDALHLMKQGLEAMPFTPMERLTKH